MVAVPPVVLNVDDSLLDRWAPLGYRETPYSQQQLRNLPWILNSKHSGFTKTSVLPPTFLGFERPVIKQSTASASIITLCKIDQLLLKLSLGT